MSRPHHLVMKPKRILRLYLINPSNPLVSILDTRKSPWNRYRVWKPLGLMVLASLTPDDWEITIFDENLGMPDYSSLPLPDLVGITAFTSQAPRAYEIATHFRRAGVTVVMGGIHATMCREEASRYADVVVTGEAESVWKDVLEDARRLRLQSCYQGGIADITRIPPARHDLLEGAYTFGSIQTTRGCPLHCSFCSVTSFNGARFRLRPVEQVIDEFRRIPEKLVLIVDDNLIGTGADHLARAKDLFRAMIRADLKKEWVGQATINVSRDEELLALAAESGCRGFFIGFESPRPAGLKEVCGKVKRGSLDDARLAVGRIQAHGIMVAGSFIIGFDDDEPGIGRLIADTAQGYGVDLVNVLFLTPLPGTRLWDEMAEQDRIVLNGFPEHWRYFTLKYPVAHYRGLTSGEATREMISCSRRFYTLPKILRRYLAGRRRGCHALMGLVGGLSYLRNIRIDRERFRDFDSRHDSHRPAGVERFGRMTGECERSIG